MDSPIFWPVFSDPKNKNNQLLALKYSSDVVGLTILSPVEWQAFHHHLSQLYRRKATVKVYDDTARIIQAFSELDVVAYVRFYRDEPYLILLGYRKYLQELCCGNCFQSSPSHILKFGLSALSMETTFSHAIHVISTVEVLVGEAADHVQYLLNDPQLLQQCGVAQADFFSHAITTVGQTLALGECFPVYSMIGLGLLFVSIVLAVDETDKVTAFERIITNKMTEILLQA
jgi:hypothetical protein